MEYGAKWGNSKRKGEAGVGGGELVGGGGGVLLPPLRSRVFTGGWRWRCTRGN